MSYLEKYLKYKNKYLILKNQIGGQIKNACGLIVSAQGKTHRLLFVKNKKGEYALPGGIIELKRGETPFPAFRREYEEEVNNTGVITYKFPEEKYGQYDYHGHTRIYYAETTKPLPNGSVQNNEVTEVYHMDISKLFLKDAHGNITVNQNLTRGGGVSIKLVSYVNNSLQAMVKDASFKAFISKYL